jgi:hypothetical protein
MSYDEVKTDLFYMKTYTIPCELDTFRVNGKAADVNDFGESRDTGTKPDGEWEPVCVYRKFFTFRKPPVGVLEKYEITLAKWREVGKALKKVLSVGECSWCL